LPEVVTYAVQQGDTLSAIALEYDTTVEAIKTANGLTSDVIQVRQRLVIPLGEVAVERVTSGPAPQGWRPSVLGGDLRAAYPLTVEAARFTLHFQPNSLPAQKRDTIVGMIETALAHIENTLQVNLEGRFDAYAAGSLFAAPDTALRGHSFSTQRHFVFLYDGSGTPADRQYILTHELTHLMTWNTMGQPASVMLHEGVAVYVGLQLVEDKGHVPLDLFCAAYHQSGQLPSLSASPPFLGHIRNLDTYYAAGSFVQFMIQGYGTGRFAEVYHTGNYCGVYGKSLADLEAEWITDLESSEYALPFDSNELVDSVAQVASAYDRLFASFTGTLAQMAAYRELDRARMALLQGSLDDTATHLAAFDALMVEQ